MRRLEQRCHKQSSPHRWAVTHAPLARAKYRVVVAMGAHEAAGRDVLVNGAGAAGEEFEPLPVEPGTPTMGGPLGVIRLRTTALPAARAGACRRPRQPGPAR